MAHDVFLSHASSDKPAADAVCIALENAAVRCWVAPRDVQPGRSFAGEITRAIQNSRVMVLIFSASSNNSEQVLREVQLAVKSHLHIIQFRIEDVHLNDDLEYFLGTPHWLDALTPPLQDHIERLTSSVRTLLGVAAEKPPNNIIAPTSPAVELAERPNDQPPVKEEPAPALEHEPPARFAVEPTNQTEGASKAAEALPIPVAGPPASKATSVGPESTPEKILSQKRISKRSLLIGGGVVAGLFLVSLFLVFRPWKSSETEITGDQKAAAADRVEKSPIAVPGPLLLIGTKYRLEKGEIIVVKGDPMPTTVIAERCGFINSSGKIIIPPQWEAAYPFYEELAAVKQDGKWGFIDKTGKIVVPPQWEEVCSFQEDLAAVKRDGKWGVIDKTGKGLVSPERFAEKTLFSQGLSRVERDRKYGFVDKTGTFVIEPAWDFALHFQEGLAAVSLGDKSGFVDRAGKVVISLRWDDASFLQDGLACVKRGGKYGFIDNSGKVVIQPQWSQAEDFNNGLAGVAVKPGPKWGFIDKTGKIVIQPKWDYVRGFINGLAWVRRADKWGLIDTTGSLVLQPQCDDIDQYNETYDAPAYFLCARQDENGVVAVWLDSSAKQIWSSADSTSPVPAPPRP